MKENGISLTSVFANFHIACFGLCDGCEAINRMKINSKLELFLEKNDKRERVIVIRFGKYKLGYVPHENNLLIYKLFEMGYADIFEASVNQINLNNHPEQQVSVVLKLKKSESCTRSTATR